MAQSKDTALTEVKRMMNDQVEAWNRGDVEQFLALGYYQSPALTFYSGGKVRHGYDEMLAHYVQRYKSEGKETGKLTFTDTEYMPVSESVMIARGRWDLDFAAEKDVGGLFTLLLWRFPDGWRIVHDHTSADD